MRVKGLGYTSSLLHWELRQFLKENGLIIQELAKKIARKVVESDSNFSNDQQSTKSTF